MEVGTQCSKTFIPNSRTFQKKSIRRLTCCRKDKMVAALALAAAQSQGPLGRRNTPCGATRCAWPCCCCIAAGYVVESCSSYTSADIDTEQQVLRINETKFHKSALGALVAMVSKELRKYLQQRSDHKTPMDPYTPLCWSGRPNRLGGAFTATGVRFNWDQICRYAGVLNHRGRPPRFMTCAIVSPSPSCSAPTNRRAPQATLPRLARLHGTSWFAVHTPLLASHETPCVCCK